METAPFLIDAGRLWQGENAPDLPLLLIDLDRTTDWPEQLHLPPCPVIGVGDPDHPVAPQLDAVIEPPVSAEGIARQVTAMPLAAGVVVQLLRTIDALPPPAALIAESLAYSALQGSAEHLAWLAAMTPQTPPGIGAIAAERSGNSLTISLDHPQTGNSIDRTMRDGLHDALALAAIDPTIDRVVLRGRGRTFSLGAQLAEFGTTRDPAAAHRIRALTLPAHQAWRVADRLEVHIQGGCVGSGLELAAWGGRVMASPDAWFQLPELAMGILPGAGGCVSLTRRIGRQRAALLILSGKRLSARQALDWGLIDAIVEQDAADECGGDIG